MKRFVLACLAIAAFVACDGESTSSIGGADKPPPSDAASPPAATADPSAPGDAGGATGSSDDAGAPGGDAGAGVEPKTFISKRGMLLFSDDFSSGALAPNWDVIGGTWNEANGELVGSSAAGERDPNVGHMSPVDRAVIQFSFSFDGTGQPGLRLNHKDADKTLDQHRVGLRFMLPTIELLELSGWGATSKSQVIATGTAKLDPKTTYDAVFEVLDRKVAFSIDGKMVVSGTTSDQSATPRNHFVLAAYGASVTYDDVKVWAALAP